MVVICRWSKTHSTNVKLLIGIGRKLGNRGLRLGTGWFLTYFLFRLNLVKKNLLVVKKVS